MPSDQSLWYRLGYALERTRQAPAAGAGKLASLRERAARKGDRRPDAPSPALPDDLLAAGAAALAAKALDAWRPRSKTGAVRLLRAGAAGAGAALLVELVRPLVDGRSGLPAPDRALVDRMLTGAAQGLLYAGVVEPRIPGPALLKGALYGSTEYAAHPAGGLTRLLGSHAPLKRVPVLGRLLEDMDPRDRAYLEHVTFGIALALLYGSSPDNNGIAPEGEA